MKAKLIFDGDCGVCTYTSEFIKRRDKNNNLEVKPYQVLNLEEINPDLNEMLASKSVYFVDENSRLFNRSKAVFETLKRLTGIYKLMGIILSNKVITFIADPVYNMIARNRGKISKLFGFSACELSKYN